jgi:S-adenosylmethionine synthetase
MNDGEIARKMETMFPMKPYDIEQRLKLRNPIYSETAAYGHMGRKYEKTIKSFSRMDNGTKVSKELEVELFTWEKDDLVPEIKNAFNL